MQKTLQASRNALEFSSSLIIILKIVWFKSLHLDVCVLFLPFFKSGSEVLKLL
jgi:hypothetical protein